MTGSNRITLFGLSHPIVALSVTAAALVLGGTACKDSKLSASAPSQPPAPATGITPVGQVSSSGFYATPVLKDNSIKSYFHEQHSFTAPCSIDPNETNPAKKDIYCILDMQELDLYMTGAGINFNAPASMCDYTAMVGYAYYAYQPGNVGTVTFTVSKDSAGNVTASTTSDAAETGVNAGGTPTCKYDYSGQTPPGPNCCEGNWTMTTTQAQSGGGSTVAVTNGQFGGQMANCLVGPATTAPKNKSGFPEVVYYRVKDSGQNFSYTINAPTNQQFTTDLYIANYFDPSIYNGSRTNYFTSTMTASNFPPPFSPTAVGAYAYPYYQYECRDVADELIARIRVLIRSWDTVAGFSDQNNPYNSGNEPYWSEPYHDFLVWIDFAPTGNYGSLGVYYPGFRL